MIYATELSCIFPLSRGSQLQLQAMPQQKGHREASLCLTCPEAAMVLDEDGFILFICLNVVFSKKIKYNGSYLCV